MYENFWSFVYISSCSNGFIFCIRLLQSIPWGCNETMVGPKLISNFCTPGKNWTGVKGPKWGWTDSEQFKGGKFRILMGWGPKFLWCHTPQGIRFPKSPHFPKSDKCKWSKIRRNLFGTAFGEERGEISNYIGVGSQISITPHSLKYKLSKKPSFSKILHVQLVQNQGELIWNSFCRLTYIVPPNFRPFTLVRFWKMRAFWKAYILKSAAS